MDPLHQTYINAILGVAFSAFGWFAREMWVAVSELKTDLAKLREELPKDYISKDEHIRGENRILAKLDQLFDLMNEKADKK